MANAPARIHLTPVGDQFNNAWVNAHAEYEPEQVDVAYVRADLADAWAVERDRLRAALVGILEHVRDEEFCYCEYKDHTEPADQGEAIDVAKLAITKKEQEDV